MSSLTSSRPPQSGCLRGAFTLGALAFVLCVGAGCVTLDLPQDFLVVERSSDSFKAVTAKDAMVWVRTVEEDGGGLAFWREAVVRDLIDHRGYVLLKERQVKDSQGTEGVELLFELSARGAPRRYLLTLFVEEDWLGHAKIRTIEYTAEKALFDQHLHDVREAIAKM